MGARSHRRKNERLNWVKPKLVANFEFLEWTDSNQFGTSSSSGCARTKILWPLFANDVILVPWKPIALVLGLLSALILVSYFGSALMHGKDPFAVSTGIGNLWLHI